MRKPIKPQSPPDWKKPKEFLETFYSLPTNVGDFDKNHLLSDLIKNLVKDLPKDKNIKDLAYQIDHSYDGDVIILGYLDRKINSNFEEEKQNYKEFLQIYEQELELYNQEMIKYEAWHDKVKLAEEKVKAAQAEVKKLKIG